MKTELQEKLFAAYPGIFQERTLTMDKTCMCWGITCGDGWYDLVDKLCQKFMLIEKATGLRIVAKQVKQKLGWFTFYFDLVSPDGKAKMEPSRFRLWEDICYDLANRAQQMSVWVCENCGKPAEGIHDLHGYKCCLCDKCLKKKQAILEAKPPKKAVKAE